MKINQEDTTPRDCWVIEPGQRSGDDMTVVFLDGDDVNRRHHDALNMAKEILESQWDLAADPEEPQEFSVTMRLGKVAPADVDWGEHQ